MVTCFSEPGIDLKKLKVGDTFITNYCDEAGVVWEVTKLGSSSLYEDLYCKSITVATAEGTMERTFCYCFEDDYQFVTLTLNSIEEW
jgi:hypothetical protein